MGEVKLCECGCGGLAPIATRTNKKFGWKKGKPTRFIFGHSLRTRKLQTRKEKSVSLCLCGCGKYASPGRRFISGHNRKGKKQPKHSDRMKGINNPMFGKRGEENPNWGRKRVDQSDRMKNGLSIYASSFIQNPSKPQRKIYGMIGEEFNSSELNFPLILDSGRGYNLDIVIPEHKIAIEYDGSYWHKNKEKDSIRQKECEDYGFKFIRYKDKVPTKLELMGDIKKIQYWV